MVVDLGSRAKEGRGPVWVMFCYDGIEANVVDDGMLAGLSDTQWVFVACSRQIDANACASSGLCLVQFRWFRASWCWNATVTSKVVLFTNSWHRNYL